LATTSSATFSARTQLTSIALHGCALAVLLLMPSGALRRSARPKELDVVFHRPAPRIEVPVAVAALALQRAALAPGPRLGRIEPPARPVAPREPSPAAPGGPIPTETPTYVEAEPTPQQKVASAGILAFKDKFAGLTQSTVAPSLGSHARFRAAVDVGQGGAPTGAMLTGSGPGGSGGIDVASLGRSVGGGGGAGGGGGGDGVSVGRATSPIAGIGGGERPLAHGGPGPSRTDEEIQIVFDRYKASFYRLYNRELRSDPTLKGQMVLRLTIEPDGSVSMCTLQSTDMNAPALSAQVVDRVRAINFGVKDGVAALTIVYPIDFLPAA
jgi:hypothetical protein